MAAAAVVAVGRARARGRSRRLCVWVGRGWVGRFGWLGSEGGGLPALGCVRWGRRTHRRMAVLAALELSGWLAGLPVWVGWCARARRDRP